MKPPIYGYLRVLPDLDQQAVSHVHDELVNFAARADFYLMNIFIERKWARFVAHDALVEHCRKNAVTNIVVPSIEHLHRMPVLGLVMQEELQELIGGRVWIAASESEEPLCPPTFIESGGHQ
jgi:hypothetical protein